MKKLLTIAFILLGMSATSQTITDKGGYSIDVTDYEIIEIIKSTNPLQGVKMVGDGYDEIVIKKGSKIQDGEREITDKTTEFAKKNAFWKTFLKKRGFTFKDESTSKKKVLGAYITETLLTFVKEE